VQGGDFIHHGFVDAEAACGVDEQYVDVVAFCIVYGGGGDVGGLLVRR
jgi:hypothetical protein